jgi:hypothetical protein
MAPQLDVEAWWNALRVYPAETAVPTQLRDAVQAARAQQPARGLSGSYALWVDAIGGPELEFFIFLDSAQYELYAEQGGTWRQISKGFARDIEFGNRAAEDAALARGEFGAEPSSLPDIRVGSQRLKLYPDVPAPAIEAR